MKNQLNNTVIPTKVYQAWGTNSNKHLGEVFAEDVNEANAQLIANEHNHFPKLLTALEKIANYDEQPIWSDDRDNAADAMLELAREALTAANQPKGHP